MFREFVVLEWERRRATLLLVSVVYAAIPVLFLAGVVQAGGNALHPGLPPCPRSASRWSSRSPSPRWSGARARGGTNGGTGGCTRFPSP